MPLDLKAVVAEKIALDKKDLTERLAAANRRQKEAERGLAQRRLLLRYVVEEVEKDQTLVRWKGSSLAHFLILFHHSSMLFNRRYPRFQFGMPFPLPIFSTMEIKFSWTRKTLTLPHAQVLVAFMWLTG